MTSRPLKIDSPTLLLLAAQWIFFLGNFAVYRTSPLPIGIHMGISLLAIHLSFTIWHEASHGTISSRPWINNAAGILGMLPYMTPFFMQRFIHLDHHKYLNETGLDPNLIYAGGPFWQMPIRYFRTISYAKNFLEKDPRSPGMRHSDHFFLALIAGIYAFALWQGFFVDLILIWLLPLAGAKVILDWYVNHLPHVGLPPDRFLGTRIITASWLRPVLLNHNYHAIHHLWPTIPWHGYVARYNEKLDYLRDHEVPIEERLFGPRILHEASAGASNANEPEQG